MKYDLPDGFYFIPVAIHDGNEYILGGHIPLNRFFRDFIDRISDMVNDYFNPLENRDKVESVKDEYGIRETFG